MTQGNRSTTRAQGIRYAQAQFQARGIQAEPLARRDGADFAVHDSGSGRSVAIKIRTRRRGRDNGWLMTSRDERETRSDLLYIFVDVEPAVPLAYIIPSGEVANLLRVSHATWLAKPGRGGRPHRDSDMRRVLSDFGFPVPGYPAGWLEQYRDRWDLVTRPVDR